MTDFTETSGQLARAAGVTSATVVRYARLGLLDFKTASDGTRLFREGQAGRVRAVLRQRLAGRAMRKQEC